MRRPSGLVLISGATAIGGAAGYVITWLVPRQIGFADYVVFAVFWSFLFLVVSALSGIQQEITRATHPSTTPAEPSARVLRFGLIASAAVFVATVCSAPLWVASAFPEHGWSLVWPLSVGAATYVWVAVLYGTLYGTSRWEPLFWLTTVEAVMRLVAIALLLEFDAGMVALAWAVALPYAATLGLLWPAIRSRSTVRSVLDVGYRQLSWNVSRTVVAATSMGLLISGFPLMLGLTSAADPPEHVGLIVLAATLIRAPLIVVTMAFQSYLIVLFRSAATAFWRMFLYLQAVVFGGAAVLGLAGWWFGPPVFAWLFPGELVPDAWFIVALVLSSALVGSLCISAPAVLARSRHSVYTAGWVAAAAATVVFLLIPIDLYPRAVLALVVGPVIGLAIHISYLVASQLKVRNSPIL